jgi:predicted transcriptional regulator
VLLQAFVFNNAADAMKSILVMINRAFGMCLFGWNTRRFLEFLRVLQGRAV